MTSKTKISNATESLVQLGLLSKQDGGGISHDDLKKAHRNLLRYLGQNEEFEKIVASLPPVPEAPGAYFGLEIEVENIHSSHYNSLPIGWSSKPDNSLRNNGMEFVSVPLLAGEVSRTALIALYALMRRQKTPVDFSWRTSIHAHLNMGELTPNQIGSFLAMYLMFEKPLFDFAGGARNETNFCVPLYESTLSDAISRFFSGKISLSDVSNKWHKYSSLNFVPLFGKPGSGAKLGTVEFRQMGGTDDLLKLTLWQHYIMRLYIWAQTYSFEQTKEKILSVKSGSAYASLRNQLFGTTAANQLPQTAARFPYPWVSFVRDCFAAGEPPLVVGKDLVTNFDKTGLGEMVKKRFKEVTGKEGVPPAKKPLASAKAKLSGKGQPFSSAGATKKLVKTSTL